MSNGLRMRIIYENPKDAPNKFVVREWLVSKFGLKASIEATVFETLDGARASIPRGLICLPRFEQDDPVIREVWL